MAIKPIAITGFKGLNNRVDPTRLGLEWQLEASNVLCDNASYLVRRPGYAEFATDVADLHGTDDGRLFLVSTTGVLSEVTADGVSRERATGFTGAPFQWAELGYAVFALSETTAWCIYPNRIVAWGIPTLDAPTLTLDTGTLGAGTYLVACILVAPDGRQGGCSGVSSIEVAEGQGIFVDAPEVAGYTTVTYLSTADGTILYQITNSDGPLTIQSLPVEGPILEYLYSYPPPLNGLVSAHRNRLCIAVWEPEHDRTVLYWSKPDAPHLFELETDYQMVAGKPVLLTQAGGALLIGTDRTLTAYTDGQPPQRLADYGALPDTATRLDSGQVAFWTDRGLCRFPPFENVTQAALIPDNRSHSTGAVLNHAGSSYFVTAMRGDIRQRSPLAPYEPLPIIANITGSAVARATATGDVD